MNSAMTLLTVCAGLMFSVACGLLAEELIFGGLFRLMAAHLPVQEQTEKNTGNPARFVKYTHAK
jgi:hypothetical protein